MKAKEYIEKYLKIHDPKSFKYNESFNNVLAPLLVEFFNEYKNGLHLPQGRVSHTVQSHTIEKCVSRTMEFHKKWKSMCENAPEGWNIKEEGFLITVNKFFNIAYNIFVDRYPSFKLASEDLE